MLQQLSLPIAKPPFKKLGRTLESACRKALFEFKLLEGVTKLGLALSGGKDSLSLLYLLHAISGRGFQKFEIHAFHVGGEFSCGSSVEVSFLSRICNELGVPFQSLVQEKEAKECYSCSRERRKILFNAAKEQDISTMAFGHHRDDNAQTILMNLFHKAEFSGNLPKLHMIDYGITIVRPLIFISEADLKAFAKEYGFSRITCQCPIGANSMRKKVDHLLSDLETLFPNVRENLSKAGLQFGSDKATRK